MVMLATMPSASTSSVSKRRSSSTTKRKDVKASTRGIWDEQEHARFLQAMKMYPKGPWKAIAAYVNTRSVRQVQTHAQKYQEKVCRRMRGLRKCKKRLVRPEHRIDDDTMELCKLVDKTVQQIGHAAQDSGSVHSPASCDSKASSGDACSLEGEVPESEQLPVKELKEVDLDMDDVPSVSESLDFLIDYLSAR